MDFITAFFGRFHPLLVHLPIGILLLSFLFECFSFREKYKVLGKAVQPALFWGSVFSIAAAITGYFLRQEGGYDEALADRHQNFGIVTAVLSLVVYVLRPKVKHWVDHRLRRKQVKLALSVPLMISLLITGHWGGSLTHGEDYLSAAISLHAGEDKDPADKIRAISDIDRAVFFNDVIQPILEARCYDCHSSTKQKGDLRLDREEFVRRGGENGLVISDGPADSSELYKRLVLPLEHDDHMPPNEKPQLSSSEIALIQYWIEERADFEKPVSDFRNEEKIKMIITSMQEPPQEFWVPAESVSPANQNSIERLKLLGITPMPVAEGNNYLMVTFTGKQNVSAEQITALQDVKEQLAWLNLSHTNVTDDQLEAVSGLTNLRVLYLNNTEITDAGLSKLEFLGQLRVLSLVHTRVSDQSISSLTKLRYLRGLFLYESEISKEGIKKLHEGNEAIRIDTGNYRLESLPTDTLVFRKPAD